MTSINKLKPFICTNSIFKETRPELFTIAESENYFIASDGVRAGVIFKSEDTSLNDKFTNNFNSVQQCIKEIRNNSEYSITINRKELLDNLKASWKVFKQNYTNLNNNITIHKDETLVILEMDTDNHELSYSVVAKNKMINMGANAIFKNVNYSKEHEYFKIGFSLKFFEEHLEFFSGNQQIDIRYKLNKFSPIITEIGDRLAILLPYRLNN